MASDITKLIYSFKKLFGRNHSSNSKEWYEESSGNLINVHKDNVWFDTIPPVVQDAINSNVVYPYEGNNKLTLTMDLSVESSKGWHTNGIKGFVPPKYGQSYSVRLFDSADNEITSSDNVGWIFDYENGYLSFENSPSMYSLPFKLHVYKYSGRTLTTALNESSPEFGTKKFSKLIGDNINNVFIVNHNLNTTEVVVSVYYINEGINEMAYVPCYIQNENSIRIEFEDAAPNVNEYKVVIIG